MGQEYIFPKKIIQPKNVAFLRVFFDNGDYFTLAGSEVAEMSIKLYDRLIWNGQSLSPVVGSGYIKLRIKEKIKLTYNDYFLYDSKEYKKGRKAYIEDCCINRYGMNCIQFFNENNWHRTLFGKTISKKDGDYLIIEFLDQPHFGGCNNKNHSVYLNNIDKRSVDRIDLDFENCEGFTVYDNEILDVQLTFDNKLVWGSWDLLRKIKSGYLKLKLDKEINYRQENLFNRKTSVKQLEERICGKRGKSKHDICHLYIGYKYAGFGVERRECLEIDDIRPVEEIERLEKLEESGKGCLDFVGGYAQSQKDGTIIIAFGKDAEKIWQN